jgi:predicted DsbA family dithiol-disulfide isomerase
MSAFNRKVKITVINDIVGAAFLLKYTLHSTSSQICPNCSIGQHELLSAISYCQETLNLPLSFEVEFMPFRLIPTSVLNENTPKISKDDFFAGTFGQDKYAAFQAAIAKWSDEKKIPMCVTLIFSRYLCSHF